MSKNRSKIPEHLQPWISARGTFQLSHVQIQMARELGMNPKKFGSLANHKQEPWKVPLAEFIEESYRQRFGRNEPADVRSIEEKVKAERVKKELKRSAKAQKKADLRWESIPQLEKEKILGSVWCTSCAVVTTITDFDYQQKDDGMILNGKCIKCGGPAARYLEGA